MSIKSMINPSITTEVEQLLLGKNFASFATLMKDGSPHVAPTWVDYDGDMVLIKYSCWKNKRKKCKFRITALHCPYTTAQIHTTW